MVEVIFFTNRDGSIKNILHSLGIRVYDSRSLQTMQDVDSAERCTKTQGAEHEGIANGTAVHHFYTN